MIMKNQNVDNFLIEEDVDDDEDELEAAAEAAAEAEEAEEGEEDAEQQEQEDAVDWIKLNSSGREASGVQSYLNAISEYKQLTPEQEKHYAALAKSGDAIARKVLASHNLRLVVSVAKKYTGYGISIDDLIGYGNIGLMDAVDRFDQDKGYRFSTYAMFWIKMRIEKGIQEYKNTIAKPDHVMAAMNAVRKVQKALEGALDREVTAAEISEAMNKKFTVDQIGMYVDLLASNTVVSLDKKIDDGEKEGAEFGDMIEDDKVESPVEYTERRERQDAIDEALSELKPTCQVVIKMRFGLGDYDTAGRQGHAGEDKEYTLDEIAEELYNQGYKNKNGEKFTKEYIRQMEKSSLEKLRQNTRLIELLQEME